MWSGVDMSDFKKLKELQSQLIRINLEINSQPSNTTESSDLKTMAEILHKQSRVTQSIREIEDQIKSRSFGRANLIKASEIKPQAVSWLWDKWIPKGKLTILAGDGGAGKTSIALKFAATISNGGLWPDKTKCLEFGNVLIWSGEDEPSDTIVPRLIACDANLDKVKIINGRTDADGKLSPFDPSKDFADLYRVALQDGGVSFLIVDPLLSLVKGDMHKANVVRQSLQPLIDFCSKTGCAVLGIHHFSKGSSGASPADRVIGSQAFVAVARSVLVADQQSGNRVLARPKNNLSVDQGGYSYAIEQFNIKSINSDCIETSGVVWGDFIDGSAAQILADIREDDCSGDESDPVLMLRRILKAGEMESNTANQTMSLNGYTLKQTRRAREKLVVKIERRGSGADTKTYWKLPNEVDVNT